ncbi:MAG: AI-2E family transporter [Isosphaeraceae bacterium]
MSSHSVTSSADENGVEETLDAHTTILRWIAGLLTAGAAWMLAPILVPFVLALALAIALSPLARRIERMGVGRTGSSLVCLVLVTGTLMFTAGLLAYQAGTILQQSDRYLDRLSRLLATATKSVGGERLLISLGAIRASEESPGPHGANPDGETDAATATSDGADQRGGMSKPARLDPVAFLKQILRSNLRLLGGWLVTGIGGIVGLIGSAVICLSFVFYLLQTRSEWINRLLRVLYFLGLRPRRDNLERIQSTITVFGGFVVMVSICGADVIGTTAWLIGLPQPYLWGVIFGLLEFVPYFGPMVGGTLLTLVALTTGEGSWWQAVTMLMVILAWLTLEGYVIAPMVYGRAVRFDPVMVLAAILFFGWLWGPLGMVTALPVMVMLRELAIMSPETPALDALMEPHQSATTAHASH